MLDKFNKRNRMYSYVNRISDYLGKSIRENTTVFNFDDVNKVVTILTESEHIIEADVNVSDQRISLNKMKVYTVDEYFSDEKFEEEVTGNATNMLSHLSDKDYSKAENEFAKIVEQYERKAQAKTSKTILEKKIRSVANRNVLETETWNKLNEVRDNFIKFLKENKETVLENSDLLNTVVLSRAIASAIQVPQITLENLSKRKRFSIPINYNDSVYDLICQKELVQRELLEAKNDFSKMYASKETMHKLSLGFNANEDHLLELVSEAVADIPMLALTTKQQLAETIARVHSVFNSAISISETKFAEFVSRIYEAKKPYKEAVTDMLNEEYGINVASLTYRPSFENLAKANSASMEILSKLTKSELPALSECLQETSKEIRNKAGFAALYISDFLNEAFTKAKILNEMDMAEGPQEIDLDAIRQHLIQIKQALLGNPEGEPGMEGEEGMEPGMEPGMEGEEEMEPGMEGEMGEVEPEIQGGPGDDDIHVDIGSHDGNPEMSPEEEYNEGEAEPEPDGDEMAVEPGMEEEIPMEGGPEEEEGMGGPPMPGPEDEVAPLDPLAGEEEETKAEIMDVLNDIEALIGKDKKEQQMPSKINPKDVNDEEI